MRAVVDYAQEKLCELREIPLVREQPGIKAFQRMLKFISKNCLNCQKGCNQEGLSPGDDLYCDICNTIENRVGWLGENKLSDRMKKRMNYPDGPCSEKTTVDRR